MVRGYGPCQVAFDGAYVYYVKDDKISEHMRISHVRSQATRPSFLGAATRTRLAALPLPRARMRLAAMLRASAVWSME